MQCPRSRSGPAKHEWLSKFTAVNGVVLPSTLKPGALPIKTRSRPSRDLVPVRTRTKDKACPICGDLFSRNVGLQGHFVSCVRRNGNPQGYHWNGSLDDERRVGREIAELYCRRDVGEDVETSTSDGSSPDIHIISYTEPSNSGSLAIKSSSSHNRNNCAGASTQTLTWTDRGYGDAVVEVLDERMADKEVDALRMSEGGRVRTPWKATKVIGPLSYGLS